MTATADARRSGSGAADCLPLSLLLPGLGARSDPPEIFDFRPRQVFPASHLLLGSLRADFSLREGGTLTPAASTLGDLARARVMVERRRPQERR